jgi:hypothetical protein
LLMHIVNTTAGMLLPTANGQPKSVKSPPDAFQAYNYRAVALANVSSLFSPKTKLSSLSCLSCSFNCSGAPLFME